MQLPDGNDVLETNVCPRSEATRANILVLSTSNYQGVTIRPIVPIHFQFKNRTETFSTFEMMKGDERRESQIESLKKETDKLCLTWIRYQAFLL